MNTNIDKLVNAISGSLTSSDVVAAKQLAKISSMIVSNRLERGMNQKQFAEFTGVSQGMVSKWESGEYNFTVETLVHICEKLNLDLDISISSKWNNLGKSKAGNLEESKWAGTRNIWDRKQE